MAARAVGMVGKRAVLAVLVVAVEETLPRLALEVLQRLDVRDEMGETVRLVQDRMEKAVAGVVLILPVVEDSLEMEDQAL